MREILTSGAFLAVGTLLTVAAGRPACGQSATSVAHATITLDNVRVRAFRTTGPSLDGVEHKPGVVVPLGDSPTRRAGEAYWLADAAVREHADAAGTGAFVIVEPKDFTPPPLPLSTTASKPGDSPFVGMSFTPLFENDKVAVIRARMEVDAREGFHTHGSDIVVVHLSGGAIEDTANGTTKVNHWKPGDVEFEARGSSHSARNVGQAIDVVLVRLKP